MSLTSLPSPLLSYITTASETPNSFFPPAWIKEPPPPCPPPLPNAPQTVPVPRGGREQASLATRLPDKFTSRNKNASPPPPPPHGLLQPAGKAARRRAPPNLRKHNITFRAMFHNGCREVFQDPRCGVAWRGGSVRNSMRIIHSLRNLAARLAISST